jgi:hypothetical protein
MRITWQDKKFDGLALSSFVAPQCRRKSYDNICHLAVEIWPPHPDRSSDVSYIYCHLRRLRDDLRAVTCLPEFYLLFLESSIAFWSNNGKPLNWLDTDPEPAGFWQTIDNDIDRILDLFVCLDNIVSVHICLPDSLSQQHRTTGFGPRGRRTDHGNLPFKC